MHIMPAVDIKEGKVVRLLQGARDRETVYGDSPADAARHWAEQGATWLHVVDLDAAFDGTSENEPRIREIAQAVDIPVQVGGGVRSLEKAERLIAAGVARVVVGTKALESRSFLETLAAALPGRIHVGVDARDGYVAVKGWTETTAQTAEDFLKRLPADRIGAVIYTDISRDGALTGPNVPALQRATKLTTIPIIASGGVSTLDDIRALAGLPLFGIISGRALYEGAFTLQEAMGVVGNREG